MSKLATVTETRDLLGFESSTDVNNAIASALENTTPLLAALLRVKDFDAFEDREDLFFVDEPEWDGVPKIGRPWNQLRLAQGFLSSAPAQVRAASHRNGLDTASDYDDLQDLEDYDRTVVDLEKGVVTIDDLVLENKYIRVVYSGGFDVENGVYQDVPAWLKTMAMLHAIVLLKTNPFIRTEGNTVDFAGAAKRLALLVNEHTRVYSLAKKPI